MNDDQDHKPVSKITPEARRRMQQRSAHNQLNDILRELREEPNDVPDADDSSVKPESLR